MSEGPSKESSISSLIFVRSKTSLKDQSIPRESIDLDELLGFREARERLAEKLAKTEEDAQVFEEPLEIGFAPHRVFVNHVDTYATKRLANFLSEQVFGASNLDMMGGGEEEAYGEEEEEEEEEGEEEEGDEEQAAPLKKTTVPKPPKEKYVVLGTLKNPEGDYDKEAISEILDPKDKFTFLDKLMKCAFIIYDISRDPTVIPEAKWVLRAIQAELDKIAETAPKAFKESKEIRQFVLISTYLTWAKTKPLDPEEPELPFNEGDFRKRKPHPNFKEHCNFEKEVVAVGKKYPEKYKTLVICSGLQYGFEEDVLNFFFQQAWENVPELPLFLPGKNVVPLIHVQDLAQIVYFTLERYPTKKSYLLAVETVTSNLKEITKAISSALGTGAVNKVPKEDMFLYDNATQDIYDSITVNINMEPAYINDAYNIKWVTETSFAENVQQVAKEYREARGLTPISIFIHGPPASGKTTLAKKLAEHYKLHYLNPDEVVQQAIQKIKDKIEKAKMKEKALEEEVREEVEEEEEKSEDDDVEEEEEAGLDELTELLEEVENSIQENEGRPADSYIMRFFKEMLASPPIKNQGYVLDGFPENVEDAKELFSPEEGAEEDEVYGEDEEGLVHLNAPEHFIVLDASDDFLYKRAMSLPEEEVQAHHYGEEEFVDRVTKYRTANADDVGIASFLDENEVHPVVVAVEKDTSNDMSNILHALTKVIGKPHNFGLTPDEQKAQDIAQVEELLWKEAQDLAKRQEEEQRAHGERMAKLQGWADMMDRLREEEEEMIAAETMPLRHYLMKYVFPTLTRGLLEVARMRPADPVDYLAEYLFKENPEGKMFEPEYSAKSHNLFSAMEACGGALFELGGVDDYEKARFFPKVWDEHDNPPE